MFNHGLDAAGMNEDAGNNSTLSGSIFGFSVLSSSSFILIKTRSDIKTTAKYIEMMEIWEGEGALSLVRE